MPDHAGSLTPLEEQALARMIGRGNLAARDRLVMKNMPLAARVAAAFRGPLPWAEARGWADLGLVRAATSFREGDKLFVTHAVPIIRRHVRHARRRWEAQRRFESSGGLRIDPAAPAAMDDRPGAAAAVRKAMAVALTEDERAEIRRAYRLDGRKLDGAGRTVVRRRAEQKLREHLGGGTT